MSLKFTNDMRNALRQQPGKPIRIDDDEFSSAHFIVDEELLERAVDAIQRIEDHAAIAEGIKQMKAGEVVSLEEADAEIRTALGFPPRQ